MTAIQCRILLILCRFDRRLLGITGQGLFGLLHFGITHLVDVIQLKIAVGNDMCHMLCHLRIFQFQLVHNLLRTLYNRFHISRVTTLAIQIHCSGGKNYRHEQQTHYT